MATASRRVEPAVIRHCGEGDSMSAASRWKGGRARRRLAFGILLAAAVLALAAGIVHGDPERIHRFASQI